MGKKLKILAAIVVIAAVLVVIMAMVGGSEKTEVRYNYEVEVVDSFTSPSGYVETASAGSVYAIVLWTVANDSYEDGFSTNDMIFNAKVVVNGIEYSTSIDNYSHPQYLLGTITEGNKATFAYVYEVPSGTAVSDVGISFEYIWTFDPPVMERDEGL